MNEDLTCEFLANGKKKLTYRNITLYTTVKNLDAIKQIKKLAKKYGFSEAKSIGTPE
jgi:hypothetical protein